MLNYLTEQRSFPAPHVSAVDVADIERYRQALGRHTGLPSSLLAAESPALFTFVVAIVVGGIPAVYNLFRIPTDDCPATTFDRLNLAIRAVAAGSILARAESLLHQYMAYSHRIITPHDLLYHIVQAANTNDDQLVALLVRETATRLPNTTLNGTVTSRVEKHLTVFRHLAAHAG